MIKSTAVFAQLLGFFSMFTNSNRQVSYILEAPLESMRTEKPVFVKFFRHDHVEYHPLSINIMKISMHRVEIHLPNIAGYFTKQILDYHIEIIFYSKIGRGKTSGSSLRPYADPDELNVVRLCSFGGRIGGHNKVIDLPNMKKCLLKTG